ncbi:MAG: TlpA family protein disulfide reductase [Anaerolineaceae bacterium]|nr:TlpA family protein disulfide reductase [Anaerolineaceae bacterium]
MKKQNYLLIASIILLLGITWMLLTPALFPAVQAGSTQAAHAGFQAPDFTLSTPDGQAVTLSDLTGKPVLVFLWASWCSVCKATMPGLEPVYQEYAPQGFEIVAVNMTSQDVASSAISYFHSQGYTYPMLLDPDGAVARQYQMHALPTSVLIGPDGIVQKVVIGAGMNAGELRAWLDEVLNTGQGE